MDRKPGHGAGAQRAAVPRRPGSARSIRLGVTLAMAAVLAGLRAAAAAADDGGLADGGGAGRADPVSTSLVIINGFLVFFMQVGFLAFETGSGRAKNVRNILLKNLLDVMLAAIVWWAVGYAFAYGRSAGGVIGTNLFFYEGGTTFDKSARPWFFSWTFCIAACTIISGCLAERTALAAYPAATLLISGLVHPLLVHWLWSPGGWMGSLGECKVLDFAGGMVVHMLGGLFGLVGAWKCGPRLGRFELVETDDLYGDGEDGGDEDGAAAAGAGGALGLVAAQALAGGDGGDGGGGGGAGIGGAADDQLSWEELAAAMAAVAQLREQQQQAAVAAGVDGAHGASGRLTLVHELGAADGAAPGTSSGLHGWPGRASADGAESSAAAEAAAAAAAAAAMGAAAGPAGPAGPAVHRPRNGCTLEVSGPLAAGQCAGAGAATGEAKPGAGGAARPAGLARALRTRLPHVPALLRPKKPGSPGADPPSPPPLPSPPSSRGRPRRAAGRCGVCRHSPKPMPGHDMAFVTLGTFMLWFGWFGFNNGSVYMYVAGNQLGTHVAGMENAVSAEVVQRTSMNTALGGASGGLTALLVAALFSGTYDLRICCNGVLSGLVTVTCMCGFVDPWAAVVCSAIAGALYTGASYALLRCGIDDPLDSSAVHLGNGLLGTILLAFVAKPEHVAALTGSRCGGVFYSSSGWLQLGLQVMAVAIVVALAGGAAWAMFTLLDHYGLLRVDQATELAGIDNMDHGGPAYPEAAAAGSAMLSGGGSGCSNAASAGRRMLR